MFVMLACEMRPVGTGQLVGSSRAKELNDCIRQAAKPFDRITLVDVNAFMDHATEVQGHNHFDRQVYYRIYNSIAEQIAFVGAEFSRRPDLAAE